LTSPVIDLRISKVNCLIDEVTFKNLPRWIQDVRSERGHDIVLVIVGNKTDLERKRLSVNRN